MREKSRPCKLMPGTIRWPSWLVEEIEAKVTVAGYRSFNRYLESIAYKEFGYTEKSFLKKCEDEGKKESKKEDKKKK